MRRRALLAASQMTSGGTPDNPNEGLDYLTIIHKDYSNGVYHLRPYQSVSSVFEIFKQIAPFYYRINDGDWIEIKDLEGGWADFNKFEYFTYDVTLSQNDRLQLKCSITWEDIYYNNYDFSTFNIMSDSAHTVCGTPLSLCYGDDFANDLAPDELLCWLFKNDTGLQAIENPETFLHCKTLQAYCYYAMFYGCTNLQNAPVLPAATLAPFCYCDMFYGCTNISHIKMLATDISAPYCLISWVEGVSPTGTFVKHPDMTSLPVGINGIPEGWTVVNDEEEEGGDNGSSESTELEFPLYLEFDWCEGDGIYKYCQRDADELGLKLYQYLAEIAVKYGDLEPTGYYVTDQIIDMIGFELYIEGEQVVTCSYSPDDSSGLSWFHTDGEIGIFNITNSGEISADVF